MCHQTLAAQDLFGSVLCGLYCNLLQLAKLIKICPRFIRNDWVTGLIKTGCGISPCTPFTVPRLLAFSLEVQYFINPTAEVTALAHNLVDSNITGDDDAIYDLSVCRM